MSIDTVYIWDSGESEKVDDAQLRNLYLELMVAIWSTVCRNMQMLCKQKRENKDSLNKFL